MQILSALLTLSAAVGVVVVAEITCPNPIYCPCGSTGKNITICQEKKSRGNEDCRKWSRCKRCQEGRSECLQCEDGFEGPFCAKSTSNNCPILNSPRLGSLRCTYNNLQRTCVGKCMPGYNFENHQSKMEITLECRGNRWTPLSEFPRCKSGGHCDLVVKDTGRFNCTTGMRGTWCDVHCDNRYSGRYNCYPGRNWDPSLPRCVRPKANANVEAICPDPGQVPNAERLNSDGRLSVGVQQFSVGQFVVYTCHPGFALQSRSLISCLASGEWSNRVPFCTRVLPPSLTNPISRTTTVVPGKQTCADPGFIPNGFRRHTDGSESNTRRSFEEGQSLVFGCQSDKFALEGHSLITCTNDGIWSNSLPRCIQPIVSSLEVMCPDPGQVANADRLNSDGTPSVEVQQYRVGQSVVYTCHPGFALQRRGFISCLASGEWSSRMPYCTSVTPPSPPNPTIGTAVENLKFCRDIGVDPNGSRLPRMPPTPRGFPQGSRVEFKCNPDYELRGDSILFCLLSGEWSASRPSCSAPPRTPDTSDNPLAYCLHPGTISNGKVVYYPSSNSIKRGEPPQVDNMEPEYPVGSGLQYSCNNGYVLEGRYLLICGDSGFWSANAPFCKRAMKPLNP